MNLPGAQTDGASPATDRSQPPALVVVGVDGSASSRQALLFAADEAQCRQALLSIVAAWDFNVTGSVVGPGFYLDEPQGSAEDALHHAARAWVKAAADTVATDLSGPPVHVRTSVVRGRASTVLLEAAADAALLVVGSRGAGPLSRLMMGSTSTAVLHHAHVPVAVVPNDRQHAGAATTDAPPLA